MDLQQLVIKLVEDQQTGKFDSFKFNTPIIEIRFFGGVKREINLFQDLKPQYDELYLNIVPHDYTENKVYTNPITWEQLKDFVNNEIPDEHLQKTIPVLLEDRETAHYLLEPFKIENDIYTDGEDFGTLEELKELREANEMEFDLEECTLATKKGTPFLWLE